MAIQRMRIEKDQIFHCQHCGERIYDDAIIHQRNNAIDVQIYHLECFEVRGHEE